MLHHIELWVPDLPRVVREWGWLLERLGHDPYQKWEHGRSWRLGPTCFVVGESSEMTATRHDLLLRGGVGGGGGQSARMRTGPASVW